MKVTVRFLCIDIYGEKNEFEFELKEGALLNDALSACLELDHVRLTLKELQDSVFLIDNLPAGPSSPLREGSRITVLRPLGGGG